jgi:hypothetical protein
MFFGLSAGFRPALHYVELNLTSLCIAFYDFPRGEEPKLVVERSFGKHSRKRNAYKKISIIPAEGGEAKELMNYDGMTTLLDWSPDGGISPFLIPEVESAKIPFRIQGWILKTYT